MQAIRDLPLFVVQKFYINSTVLPGVFLKSVNKKDLLQC